jgi:hypothetical protein
MRPADRESGYRAIERLIATYAELVDDGDFAAVGRLLADATFTGGTGVVTVAMPSRRCSATTSSSMTTGRPGRST